MKRKRGPAPSKKETRRKSEPVEEVEESSHLEDGSDVEDGEDGSFEGFSSDGEEMQVDGQQAKANGTQNGQVAVKKRGIKAVPTQEELLELEFRSSSFQSNLFKLQVDELLSEIRVKHDKMEKVERILHRLKDVLTNMPETEEQLVLSFYTWILI
jgi:U3 small nucleolar RNA-associated protein 22